MTNRKRVYLPPITQAAVDALRLEPGYAEETDATLLSILTDRANRGTTTTPRTTEEPPATIGPLDDIVLDF